MTEHGRHRAAPKRAAKHRARRRLPAASLGSVTMVAAGLVFVVRPSAAPVHVDVNVEAMSAVQDAVPNARSVGQDYSLVVRKQKIDFATVTVKDNTVAKGVTFVKTEGASGSEQVTYRVLLSRGKEVSRSVVQRVAVRAAVDAVVVQGTGDPSVVGASLDQLAAGTTKPDGARAWAKVYILKSYGWGPDQFSCLDNLWTHESNWRYKAANKSSSAYGIPQALPGKRMATYGKDWKTNPTVQMRWGFNYIDKRYHSPCGAWSAFQHKGWY